MSSTRKVALFSTSFLQFSQTFVYDEIKAHSENYEVTVFCKDRQNEDRFPFKNYHKPEGKFAETIYMNLAYWPKFDRIIKQGGFDLIHAHFGTGAIYALPYVKKYKLPFVVTFHGNDVAALIGNQRYLPSKWRYVSKSKELFEYLDLGLVVSPELITLLEKLGCDKKKLELFRLGIDLEKFSPKPKPAFDTINFLLIGRFIEKKGHIYALKAFQKLLSKNKNVSLSFVGDGKLQDSLKAYCNENNLSNHVSFLGIKNSTEIQQIINNSHVLLVPSVVAKNGDREGLPTVIKEANACALPAIGTYHSGIPNLIKNDFSGFLVEERSIEQLYEKMLFFVENPSKINEFGENAKKIIDRDYDIRKEVSRLEQFYELLIKRK